MGSCVSSHEGGRTEEDGWTSLSYVTKEGNREFTDVIIVRNGADGGWTPLSYSVKHGNRELAETLIHNRTELNTVNEYGRTPLFYPARYGNSDLVETLIRNGANVNKADEHGWTPLFCPARYGNTEIAELLIRNGANVNKVDKVGWTPLFYAARYGHREVADILTHNGAKIDKVNENGWTPLFCPARHGNTEIAEILIHNGANVNKVDKAEWTPLLYAVKYGHREVIEMLIANGANVNKADKNGWSPLLEAAFKGSRELAEILIYNGADVNKADKDGWTPLFETARYGHRELAEILIANRANVNQVENHGSTPLFVATRYENTELADVLLRNGASTNEFDEVGWTPLFYSARCGSKELVEMLLLNGANVDFVDIHGSTPLFVATRHGNTEVAEVLISSGANLNEIDKVGWTPLFYAARYGNKELVEMLLLHGANLDLADKKGETAESVAKINGHAECMLLLQKTGFERKVKAFATDKSLSLEEVSIPIKTFVIGKAYAGKSQLLKSLLKDDKDYKRSHNDVKKVESDFVRKEYLERTLGLEVYDSKLDDSPCTFYDFGGIDNYYLLHSVFAKFEDSIILIVFDVSNQGEIKTQDELKDEISKQIRFIKSRSGSNFDNKILLVGTHIDRIEPSQREKVFTLCDWVLVSLEEEGFNLQKYLIINGKDPESEGIKHVWSRLVEMTSLIRSHLENSKKMVPKFIFDIHQALTVQTHSKERKVLDWEIVLDAAESILKGAGIDNPPGKYIYNLCALLQFYGKLLLTRVDDLPDESYNKRDCEHLFVITDLNWVFSAFLGVLFSPSGYLKNPQIASDGFISIPHLKMAFKSFNLEIETILMVLRHFKLMVEVKGVQGKVMIPGALANYKQPSFICSGKTFAFIIARECEQMCKALNVATLPEIQVKVGERFHSVGINYFCGGLYFKQDCYVILLEALKLQTSVQVRVGALKDCMEPGKDEECRKRAGELVDIIYREIVCGTISDKNVSGKKVHYALSWSSLIDEESEEGNMHHKLYNLDSVINEYAKGSKIINHCNGCQTRDHTDMLLTASEIEDIQRRQLSWLPPEKEENGVDLLKDVKQDVRRQIIFALDGPDPLDKWDRLAWQFEETRDEISTIRAKANKYECARELLWQLRLHKKEEKIEALERCFTNMRRIDLVLVLRDDSLSGKSLEELPEAIIDCLACKMCDSISCDVPVDNMHQLADDFGLDRYALTHHLHTCKDVSPTDEVLSLLIERNPLFKVTQLAEVLKKMGRQNLVDLLLPE